MLRDKNPIVVDVGPETGSVAVDEGLWQPPDAAGTLGVRNAERVEDPVTSDHPVPVMAQPSLSFLSAPAEMALAGKSFRYHVELTGGPGATLEIAEGPAGMSISKDGVLTWEPSAQDVGTAEVTLQAVDGEAEVSQSFVLSVLGVDRLAGEEVGAEGGTVGVSSEEEGLRGAGVVVPAGALSGEAHIEVGALSDSLEVPGVETGSTSTALVLGPSGTTFGQPAVVHLPYGRGLDGSAGALEAFVLDESTGVWGSARVVGRDSEGRVLMVEAPHFSVYVAGAPSLSVRTEVVRSEHGCEPGAAMRGALEQRAGAVSASAVAGLSPFFVKELLEAEGVSDLKTLVHHPAFIGTLRAIWEAELRSEQDGRPIGERHLVVSLLLPGDGSARSVVTDAAGNVLHQREHVDLAAAWRNEIEPLMLGDALVFAVDAPVDVALRARARVFLRYRQGDATTLPLSEGAMGRFAASGESAGAAAQAPRSGDKDCDGLADTYDPRVEVPAQIEAEPAGMVRAHARRSVHLSCAVRAAGEVRPLSWEVDVPSATLIPEGDEGVMLIAAQVGLHRVRCSLPVEGGHVSHTFAVQVTAPPAENTPPMCEISVREPVVAPGELTEVTAHASDAESPRTALRIHWGLLGPDGKSLMETPLLAALEGPENTFFALAPGRYALACQAHDGLLAGPVGSARVEVVKAEVNLPPAHLHIAPLMVTVQANEDVHLFARAEDPEGDPLHFSWLPPDLLRHRVDGKDHSEATFASPEPGLFVIEVEVHDGHNPPLRAVARVAVRAPEIEPGPDPDPAPGPAACATQQDCAHLDDACASHVCEQGACRPRPVSCDDHDPCTVDFCDPMRGGCGNDRVADCGTSCVTPEDCDSNDLCTPLDCVESRCVIAPWPCADHDPCTHDHCDPATGACTHEPTPHCDHEPQPCERDLDCPGPEDPCAEARCEAGQCRIGPLHCDDGDPCTRDFCDAARGSCGTEIINGCGAECQLDVQCGTDDLCATLECRGGRCLPGPPVCDDGDPCTHDHCDPRDGRCSHPPAPHCGP